MRSACIIECDAWPTLASLLLVATALWGGRSAKYEIPPPPSMLGPFLLCPDCVGGTDLAGRPIPRPPPEHLFLGIRACADGGRSLCMLLFRKTMEGRKRRQEGAYHYQCSDCSVGQAKQCKRNFVFRAPRYGGGGEGQGGMNVVPVRTKVAPEADDI